MIESISFKFLILVIILILFRFGIYRLLYKLANNDKSFIGVAGLVDVLVSIFLSIVVWLIIKKFNIIMPWLNNLNYKNLEGLVLCFVIVELTKIPFYGWYKYKIKNLF